MTNKAPQPSNLFDLRLLEEMNDPEFLRNILRTFLADMPDQINQLQEAAIQKDFDRVRYLSHKLKGVVGIFLAVPLCDQLSKIEEQAHSRMDTATMIQPVITMYNELERGLKIELLARTASHVADRSILIYPTNANDENTGSRR